VGGGWCIYRLCAWQLLGLWLFFLALFLNFTSLAGVERSVVYAFWGVLYAWFRLSAHGYWMLPVSPFWMPAYLLIFESIFLYSSLASITFFYFHYIIFLFLILALVGYEVVRELR